MVCLPVLESLFNKVADVRSATLLKRGAITDKWTTSLKMFLYLPTANAT